LDKEGTNVLVAYADVRKRLKEAEIKHWMLANKLGCHETTLSRWLRTELPPKKKELIFKAIDQLKRELESREKTEQLQDELTRL